MKNTISITSIIFTLGLLLILPVVWGDVAWGDSDYSWDGMKEYKKKSSRIADTVTPLYKEECGSCHMTYPAGLLPERSWKKMMSDLENHFGDNAELDNESQQIIQTFLIENSADKSDYRRSHKFNRSIKKADTPLRISDIPYFKHEHDEIPQRMVTGNPKVNSFSQCNTCHAKAEQGSFNEDDVRIPGYGRWDD